MSNFAPGQAITDTFFEYNATLGLVQADFTLTLFKNGAISLLPVTLLEVANGFYSVSFTPDSVGLWTLDVVLTLDDTARYQMAYTVNEPFSSQASVDSLQSSVNDLQSSVDSIDLELDDVITGILDEPVSAHLIAGTLGDYINRIKKYACNRVVLAGTVYSVKEDDKIAEFEAGTVTAIERTPD